MAPVAARLWERAEHPAELFHNLKKLNIGGATFPQTAGGQGLSLRWPAWTAA